MKGILINMFYQTGFAGNRSQVKKRLWQGDECLGNCKREYGHEGD